MEPVPSIPAYRNWPSSEMARMSGFAPALCDEVIEALASDRTAMVFGFVVAELGTEA